MRQLVNQLLSFVPTRLPVGMTEFMSWSDEIIELTGPLADTDSMRWVIAAQIQHLGSTSDRVPKRFFVSALRKGAATQIASQVFYDIKTKQKEAAEAAAKVLETAAEVQETATPGVE